MDHRQNRRHFLETTVATGVAAYWTSTRASSGAEDSARDTAPDRDARQGKLTVNDDGHVFLWLSDELDKADLRHYLQSYCRPGVNTVAYCVGDKSWPTLYPTKVGTHYSAIRGNNDFRRMRLYKNVDRFSSEPGGYFGATFAILHELGKKVLASFRMNDAHIASAENPYVSEFCKQHPELALGATYGYYGNCQNYSSDLVRTHLVDLVLEFAELYPEIDGIELDAMRSPFYFPAGKGSDGAPLFTEMVRKIKSGLAAQSKRLKKPDYLLTVNVPLTPKLASECGLDVATWDAEKLFDYISVGAYQAEMNMPIEKWKKLLVRGTPVYPYINCGIQAGRYLGLEEYRAAAANAYGAGADGVYLFNYPCLFELAMQVPADAKEVKMALPDMRNCRQPDFSKVGQALDEIGRAESLRDKNKHFLFYFNTDSDYRHYSPTLAGMDRQSGQPLLKAPLRCYEEYDCARELTLQFKIENVTRTEQFTVSLNGKPIETGRQKLRYAANGRDTRTHTVTLGPYQEYEITLLPGELCTGENVLEVTPTRLNRDLTTAINLTEIELIVGYGQA